MTNIHPILLTQTGTPPAAGTGTDIGNVGFSVYTGTTSGNI